MKNSTSIVIGVIVIIAVVFLAMQYANTDEEDQQAALYPSISPAVQNELTELAPSDVPVTSPSQIPKLATISIDDTGFTPSTLTIAAGTTVLFTNNGQALHWPASDPHPTHGGMSGFDAKKGLATGEVYSFVFTKAGTFGMHDHLNVKLKATIIVQ